MTKEECISLLNSYAEYGDIGIPNLFRFREAMKTSAELLQQPSLPSNLDEAAEEIAKSEIPVEAGEALDLNGDCYETNDINWPERYGFIRGFKAGAEWLARQGWIDDGSMPPETKYEGNTMQGHREWTESEPVLAWDSMYGPRVDVTKNGKWMSEQRGGYAGQICHGIIAWRPIPEYKEKQ